MASFAIVGALALFSGEDASAGEGPAGTEGGAVGAACIGGPCETGGGAVGAACEGGSRKVGGGACGRGGGPEETVGGSTPVGVDGSTTGEPGVCPEVGITYAEDAGGGAEVGRGWEGDLGISANITGAL